MLWVARSPYTGIAEAVAGGGFDVRARAVPLSEVEQAWTATAQTSDRIVLVP